MAARPSHFRSVQHVRRGFGEDAEVISERLFMWTSASKPSLITNDITSQCRYVYVHQWETANTKSVIMKSFVNE